MKRDKKTPVTPPRRAPLPPELCEHVAFMVGKAHQEMVARMDPITAPQGLSIRHLGIVLLISKRGALRQTELADSVRLDRTTCMNMIDELEDAGFVRREADPDDRRANAVTVTARGRQWLEKLRPAAEKAERDFLSPLSAPEQARLRELLMRLVVAA